MKYFISLAANVVGCRAKLRLFPQGKINKGQHVSVSIKSLLHPEKIPNAVKSVYKVLLNNMLTKKGAISPKYYSFNVIQYSAVVEEEK